MLQRTRHRRIVAVAALVLVVLVADLVLGGSHPATFTFMLGLLVAGILLGVRQANVAPGGELVPTASERRTNVALAVGVIAAVVVGVSRVLGVERNGLQDVLAVVLVAIAGFALGLSATALRSLPRGRG
jgi:hypothetical protein